MSIFPTTEKSLSQIPALQLLANVGYELLTPKKALALRGGKNSNVLLQDILGKQLAKINRIHYKGEDYAFSEANIQEAIQKLKNVNYDGLLKTNNIIYDLITLGTALEQTIEGNTKSFNLNYIDWKTPANNVFHAVPEYAVERSRSFETVRPDIVLFVNGIALCVIECKAPNIEISKAVSQHIRNQGDDYIPKLFASAQLVLGVNKNAATYATVGTAKEFWSVWNELEDEEDKVAAVVNTALSDAQKEALFCGEFARERNVFDAIANEGERGVTEQDKALYSLCRPERLLDLTYRFTLFDAGIKKIARYQQFFVTREAISRIKQHDSEGNRSGGMIWHTQGSGKSLTMVMLARNLVLDKEIKNPRIVLVTDRSDLDKQLGNTFNACELSMKRATSGRNLVKHLKNKVGIITTLVHKFDKGWGAEKFVDDSADIFVLVDESHRTHFGSLAVRMRQMLPNACYLGFTGTPLLKVDKNSFSKFGGLIKPHYSIKQAVKDKAVVPLLYEGRHVEMEQDQAAMDIWFERHTADLTAKEKADLKRKYARAEMLNKSDPVVYMRAFDMSEHYRANWQGTGFKAQLVAPSKATALAYHKFLNEVGVVSSEVIISAPDMREGHEAVDEGTTDEVVKFWGRMMQRFGSEEEYVKQIIERFKNSDNEPEILIVVDKLITGFDAPRNTVLYLCRKLREHTLLQAIARVNRLHEGKEFGYIIDYASVLEELDKSLTMYSAFEGFDEEDIAETLASVNVEVAKLAQQYSDLWDIFREVKNKRDEEAFEILLADDEVRENFYECFFKYSKTLSIALSTDKFMQETDEAKLKNYKDDLKRFQKLKDAVRLRYADGVDYREYEPKIKKLLDKHIQANEVTRLNQPVDVFDDEEFAAVMEGQGIYSGKSTTAKADTIAHATRKVIHDKMEQDPAFYEKFSKLIQQAIDDFRAQRMSDLEYLNKVSDIRDKVVSKHHEDVPESISGNDEACAYYGVILPYFMNIDAADERENEAERERIEMVSAETALAIQRIIKDQWKVDFWTDDSAQKSAMNGIDDVFYDEVKVKFDVELNPEQMDEIIEKTMQIARSRKR